MVVYDVTDPASFKSVEMWMEEVEKFAVPGVCRMLIGNKCDLESERKVSAEDGAALAKRYGVRFVETSARIDTNVMEAFKTMAGEMHARASRKRLMARNGSYGAMQKGKKIMLSKEDCVAEKPRGKYEG